MAKINKVRKLLNENQIAFEEDSKGENYKLKHCPYCGNSSSKLEVRIDCGAHHCWVCNESGSFTKLKMKIADGGRDQEQSCGDSSRLTGLSKKAQSFHNKIFIRQEGLQYLKSRGFNEESIRNFKLGCQKVGGKTTIAVPHISSGVVVNIKYRSIDGSEPKWRQEKGAKKILFNLDAMKNRKTVVLVEGELKAIALDQVGIKNVLALTGGINNVPDEWIDELKKFRTVFICMDSDKPGQQGAIQIAKRIGLAKCKNIIFSDAKDPDEYLFDRKHTKKDFLELQKQSVNFRIEDCFKGLKNAAEIEREDVEFLWWPYIPLAKITLLDGDPGIGKSNLALSIAASVSRGDQPWPPSLGTDLISSEVLIFCGEDGAADTVKPRLESQKARLESIYIFEDLIKFDEDGLNNIRGMIQEKRPSLVIFDPITPFLGGKIDFNRANEMREPLSKLGAIAKEFDCSVILVRHLNKGTKDQAIYRGLGSIDTAGVARSILLVGRHPNDTELRVMIHIKSNLAKEGRPLLFKIEDGIFKWAGKCDLDPNDILYPSKDNDQDQIQKAKTFLMEELSFGSISSNELKTKATMQGISVRTLERAKSVLGVKSQRVGSNGHQGAGSYHWHLEGVPEIENEGNTGGLNELLN